MFSGCKVGINDILKKKAHNRTGVLSLGQQTVMRQRCLPDPHTQSPPPCTDRSDAAPPWQLPGHRSHCRNIDGDGVLVKASLRCGKSDQDVVQIRERDADLGYFQGLSGRGGGRDYNTGR